MSDIYLGDRNGISWSYTRWSIGGLDGEKRGRSKGEIGIVVGDDSVVVIYLTLNTGSFLTGLVKDRGRSKNMMSILRAVGGDWSVLGWLEQMILWEGSMALLMAWMRKEGKGRGVDTARDEEIVEAHRVVIGGLGDADFCAKVELATGRNLRDQITTEEAVELMKEMELLRMGNGRN